MDEGQQEEVVEIYFGEWNKESNLEMIKNMTEWKPIILEIVGNQRQRILKDISHITFWKLKTLLVDQNMITSIEGINNIFMPQLRVLSLCQNRIRSGKEFRKVHWPQLTRLVLNNNLLLNGEALTQSYLPRLKYLFMNWTGWGIIQMEDELFLLKLQAELNQLQMSKWKIRIQQKIKHLQNRFLQINISV